MSDMTSHAQAEAVTSAASNSEHQSEAGSANRSNGGTGRLGDPETGKDGQSADSGGEDEGGLALLVNDRLDDADPPRWLSQIKDKVPPGVSITYFGRLYNNTDSKAVKGRNTAARAKARNNGQTYQGALRLLAGRICLDPNAGPLLKEAQKEALLKTRNFLGQGFFDFMKKHGVLVVRGNENWHWAEIKTAVEAAGAVSLNNDIAASRKRKRADTDSDSNAE